MLAEGRELVLLRQFKIKTIQEYSMTKDNSSNKMQEKKNYSDLLNKGASVPIKEIIENPNASITALKAATDDSMYQIIDLPSRGWTYDQNSPLSSGKLKLKIPTAREQAILSSQNLIRKGLMIDEFLKALILDRIHINDLLSGDKLYALYAARRMTYGNDYQVSVQCPKCNHVEESVKFNLAEIPLKDSSKLFQHPRETKQFEFTLPVSQKIVKFKLNDGWTEQMIEKRLNNNKNPNMETLIRTVAQITQFEGHTKFGDILNEIVNVPARDTLALRHYIYDISPDFNMEITHSCDRCYRDSEVLIPFTGEFFWPSNN